MPRPNLKTVQNALLWLLILAWALLLAGCSKSASSQNNNSSHNAGVSTSLSAVARPNDPVVLVPSADGVEVYSAAAASIDASNKSQGYIMVNYFGSNPKVKLQITTPDNMKYTYTLHGDWEVFPLTGGSGTYQCNVFENVSGTDYAYALSQTITAEITDEFLPFLYPNQYVNFSASSRTVAKGAELATGAANDLEVVDAIYEYVVRHTTYDYEKADTVQSGYLPNVDEILASGTGICFDYSAVMTTMLRTQGIPTRLDVGWAGDIYHAWISVYITDIGWIDGIIEFDGSGWHRMDPTFASNEKQSKSIMKFIADDSNYNIKYVY